LITTRTNNVQNAELSAKVDH